MKKTYKNNAKKDRKEELKKITAELEESVRNFMEGDRYKRFLTQMAKFHDYSLNNQILIATQRPDATMCASYATWRQMDRYVRAGEKGIQILCPAPYKTETLEDVIDKTTGKPILSDDGTPQQEIVEHSHTYFVIGHTFDVRQTEGKPLEELTAPLRGDLTDRQRELRDALLKICPVPVSFQAIEGSANGYYNLKTKEIVIDSNLSETHALKTLIHETSHAMLHDADKVPDAPKDSRTREVQAESIAYVVSNYFGIDTSEYSFGYIAGWSAGKETPELKNSLQVIRDTSNDIIEKTEKILTKKETAEQVLAEQVLAEKPARKRRCL